MLLKQGTLIIWRKKRFVLVDTKPDYYVLRGEETAQHSVLERDQFNQEYIDCQLYVDGQPSLYGEQIALSEKEQERIEFRRPYAEIFNLKNITRARGRLLIKKIARDNHHGKPPSRASVYRWAKKLREAGGDIRSLK